MGHLLQQQGAKVWRVNVCAGDWLHWRGPEATSYRGDTAGWAAFVDAFMERHQITDLVLHGDQRVYHKAAITQAQARGVRVFVTELGLLRSGWMTLEREGLATLSRFPNDPDQIRTIARGVGEIALSPAFPKSAWLEIGPDVIYNLTNVFFKLAYPKYQRHTLYPPVLEYARGAWRLLSERRRDAKVGRQIDALFRNGNPYFILPLQLEGDFQLRAHSPFESFAQVIEHVFISFAANAPETAQLVLKAHPLDVGFERWPQVVRHLSRRLAIGERIIYLDGGRLDALFEKASGLVTLNSTAGLEAMMAGVPVATLTPAHYDIDGLTHQGGLDTFWNRPAATDAGLLKDYLTAVAAAIQVRGSIHNKAGVEAAAKNMVRRILDLSVNEPGAFLPEPPRLASARAIGVDL